MIEQNTDRAGSILVTSAVIMFFAAIPIGIFIVSFTHQSFYLKRDYWYFDSPASAYISMVSMFLAIPFLLVAIAIYISKSFESTKRNWIVMVSSAITMMIIGIGGYLSIDNYYYMDRNGLYYDGLWKLEKEVYAWDDITEIKQVNKKENGTLTPEKFVFTYGINKVELPLSPKLRNEINPVINYIEKEKGLTLIMEVITVDEK